MNIQTDPLAEQKLFSIRPTALFIYIGYILAALAGIGLVVALWYLGLPVGYWWVSLLAGLTPLLIPAYHHFKRNMVRYTVTDAKIEIDEGFISRTTRNVPLSKIQDVTVTASIPQRLLGFGNLIIENASETEGKIVLENINSPKHYADQLLRQIRLLDR
jgi:uncharacterized membrane protein YdbT with pleckstrin-like domain